MAVTVGTNFSSVLHAGSNGISIAFPDVCKTPIPVGVTPLPYPTLAKTANAVQQKRRTTGVGLKGVSSFKVSGLTSAAQSASARQSEILQLKAMMNQINTKMLAMTTIDPIQWQAVIQEYVVATSALYVTIHGG
jgi:hypothetical protein